MIQGLLLSAKAYSVQLCLVASVWFDAGRNDLISMNGTWQMVAKMGILTMERIKKDNLYFMNNKPVSDFV